MLDLNKLNIMLDRALDSETSESLNCWIEEHIAEDPALGIFREAEFGTLNISDISSKDFPLDQTTIEMGMTEYVSYNKVFISDSYDSTSYDTTNLAA